MDKEVRMGEIEAGKADDNLLALGIGSCVVITLYDSKQKIGALTHAMLPVRRSSFVVRDSKNESRITNDESRITNDESPDTRYVDVAIDQMLKKMQELGARKHDIEAKIIGGANMFSAFISNIGKENISNAKNKLKKEGIAIVGEVTGGSQGRSVEFSIASGIVTVKTKF